MHIARLPILALPNGPSMATTVRFVSLGTGTRYLRKRGRGYLSKEEGQLKASLWFGFSGLSLLTVSRRYNLCRNLPQDHMFIAATHQGGSAMLNTPVTKAAIVLSSFFFFGCAEMQSMGGSDALMKLVTSQLGGKGKASERRFQRARQGYPRNRQLHESGEGSWSGHGAGRR
jgi:hypothetical protein